MSTHEEQHHTPSAKDGYEHQDFKAINGIWMSIVFIIFMVLTFVFLNEWFNFTVESEKHDTQMIPQSVLLRDVRAREQEILTTYAVIDSTKGIYRVPITKAMEMMVDSAFAQQVKTGGKK